ncbi:uncharacterized protein BN803_01951 [Firmicutes bacterium CAG:882]|jgi:hypothetical protein|nr:uncharacterized protein BN803_01951 [Firmicutes bacterium CAG:882]
MYTTLEKVKNRLKQFHTDTVTNDDGTTTNVVVFDNIEDNPYIEQLIEQSRQEIISLRNYPSSYTQEQIDNDVAKYENIIVNLTVYDHSQAGEAYMASYSENGISRNWVERNKLLTGVIPLVKVF